MQATAQPAVIEDVPLPAAPELTSSQALSSLEHPIASPWAARSRAVLSSIRPARARARTEPSSRRSNISQSIPALTSTFAANRPAVPAPTIPITPTGVESATRMVWGSPGPAGTHAAILVRRAASVTRQNNCANQQEPATGCSTPRPELSVGRVRAGDPSTALGRYRPRARQHDDLRQEPAPAR